MVLPDGWKRCALGEIAQVTSGGTPDRSTAEYWGGSIPWVTTGEIQFNTITDTAEKISEAGLKNSAAKKFTPGTLLMAMYGQGKTRGQVAKLGIEAATNQACAAILLNENEDTEFFYQFLSSHYEAIRKLGNAGTQKNLSGSIIKEISVPVPPRREQQKIAEILATWDEAIRATERLIANSQEQKKALVQRYFSAPIHKRRAAEIFTPRSVRRNDGLELLSVMQDVGVVPRRLLERKVAMPDGSTEAYKLVEPGDFVISLRSFEGGLEYSKFKGLVSPAYTVLKSSMVICDDYFRHYFKSREFIGRLAVAVIGIRDGKQISYEDFSFIKLPCPDIEDQKHIAAVLNQAEVLIQTLQEQLENLRAEKRALMQQLLTGKRRVRINQPITEASPA